MDFKLTDAYEFMDFKLTEQYEFTHFNVSFIKAQLERFTYKAGWRFEVRLFEFVIIFKCEDTYNPGNMIEVVRASPLWIIPCGNPETFAWWLAEEIKAVEIHESREWLKRDGKIYNDPHA
jgi:hypothetical protein